MILIFKLNVYLTAEQAPITNLKDLTNKLLKNCKSPLKHDASTDFTLVDRQKLVGGIAKSLTVTVQAWGVTKRRTHREEGIKDCSED